MSQMTIWLLAKFKRSFKLCSYVDHTATNACIWVCGMLQSRDYIRCILVWFKISFGKIKSWNVAHLEFEGTQCIMCLPTLLWQYTFSFNVLFKCCAWPPAWTAQVAICGSTNWAPTYFGSNPSCSAIFQYIVCKQPWLWKPIHPTVIHDMHWSIWQYHVFQFLS